MLCKLCQADLTPLHQAKILGRYEVSYFHCPNCQFIQMEPEYWLEEAYQETINISDTGYMSRNIALSKVTSVLLSLYFSASAQCLDYAGGYGVFVRLMRDIGFDFYWQDKYTENLFARGFEARENENYQLITSFESFEHFDSPLQEIENMLARSDSILFSTVLWGKQIPPPDWHYFGLEHGQHIAFYHYTSLKYIADKYSLNLYSDGKSIHLLTPQKINPWVFGIMTKMARLGVADVIKLFKKSKTLSDWNLMRKT